MGCKQIVIGGVSHNAREWSKISGVSYSTIRDRIAKGVTGEEIIRPSEGQIKKILITINGTTKSICEWANISGISRQLVYLRYKSGKTGAKLIEAPHQKKQVKSLTIGDETRSLAQWADIYGIPRTTMYERYKRGIRGRKLLMPVAKNCKAESMQDCFNCPFDDCIRASKYLLLDEATVGEYNGASVFRKTRKPNGV